MRTRLGIALAPLALQLALGCGTTSATAPRPGDRAIAPLAEVTAKLEVRRLEGRPPLAIVARGGDPTPAFAAVLLVDDGAMAGAPGLAAALEERLRERGAEARVARGAVVVTWDGSETVAALRAFTAALRAPIGASPTLSRRAAELAGPVVPRALDAAARCSGAPPLSDGTAVADIGKPEGASTIEALRRVTATAERTSLAIVGSQANVDEAVRELDGGAAWSSGTAPQRASATDLTVTVVEPEGPAASVRREGDADLVVGIELARAASAPTLARALDDARAPVATRLSLLRPRFAIVDASGVSRPGGAGSCLRLDLRARRPDAIDADAVGYAVRIVRDAQRAASPADEKAAAARAIVTAGDPRDAAARAAWWTTTSDGAAPSTAPAFVAIAQRAGKGARVAPDEATRAIATMASAPPRAIEERVRPEPGQGGFVMSVGSPCPAVDTRTLVDSAGLAIGLVAAATATVAEGVELTPFLGAEGAGLVARGEARAGEDARGLAKRVARALAAALAGRPPPVAEIERARARLVERAALEWGQPEASEAVLRAMVPERPLALAPLGLESALVRAEAARATNTPADVLAGPVRVAILPNVDAEQAAAAIAALREQLPPGAAAPCGPAPAPTGARGRIDVRVAGDERTAQLSFALEALSVEAAEVALSILDEEGGELRRTAASVGASARSRRVGTTVLIDVRVAPERTEDAFATLQAALDRIARAPIDDRAARTMSEAARNRLRAAVADPVERAIALWRTGTVTYAGVPEPRSIAPKLAAAAWVVVVARPS